jgi:hypothetical protein
MATLQDYGSDWHNAAARGDLATMEKLLKKGMSHSYPTFDFVAMDGRAHLTEQTPS